MEDINKRISIVVEYSKLTKTAFAKRINVSQGLISQICNGLTKPSDRTISDICEKFSINEDWLRYGTGPMNRPVNRNKEIENFMNEVLHMESEDFRRRFISALTRLSEDEWELLESMTLKLSEETEKGQDES